MSAQLRAELLKLRSTQTNLGLCSAMLGLVLFVVLLHGFAVSAEDVGTPSTQLNMVFGWAELLVSLFAALFGALSITGEFQHGTIRPTFLVTPQRGRVVAAKVWASMLIAGAFGVLAGGIAIGTGIVALASRGIGVELEGEDYALLLAGCIVAAALWAAIGVGVGAVVRNQVPTAVGISVWLLFVEQVLLGDILDDLGWFMPGALAKAASGLGTDPAVAPVPAALLLGLYALVATVAGRAAMTRRDVA